MYNKPTEDSNGQIPTITDINREEEVSTTVEAPTVEYSISQSTISSSTIREADHIIENLKITRHQQISLATSTATQASNRKWHEHRKGSITASVAAECAAKVTAEQIRSGHSGVAKIMGYYGKVTSPSLQWGKDVETVAKRQYIAYHKSKHKHQGVSCQETGLWVSLQHPFPVGSIFNLQRSGSYAAQIEAILELVLCRRGVKSHTGAGEEIKVKRRDSRQNPRTKTIIKDGTRRDKKLSNDEMRVHSKAWSEVYSSLDPAGSRTPLMAGRATSWKATLVGARTAVVGS